LDTFGDFRPTFGGFWSTLRRFLQAGSTFCGLLAKSFSADFCTPFLGSIFDPFSDFSLRAICWFYGTFWPTRVVFGPFLDVFWTVHFIMIFATLGLMCLVAVLAWLVGRRLVQGLAWVYVAYIRRISTLHVFPFAIIFVDLSRPLKVRVMPTSLFGDGTGSISIVGARVCVDLCSLLFLR
jgi:hypothetical protein